MARARASAIALILLVVIVSASFVTNTEARKLLAATNGEKQQGSSGGISVPSLFQSLLLSALPKGTVPASTPSKKGHATTLGNVERFERHLASIDRILRSVPSPGVGH